MDQKLIFLDIDGTLTEPGKNVPPRLRWRRYAGPGKKGTR